MTSPWNTLVILAYFDLSRSGLGAKGRHMVSHLLGTILVIDDEPSMVRALTGLLRRDGYCVDTASNGRHALAQLQERHYDVIVCDLQMPVLDGQPSTPSWRGSIRPCANGSFFSQVIPGGRQHGISYAIWPPRVYPGGA
jgi:hypothetical protein